MAIVGACRPLYLFVAFNRCLGMPFQHAAIRGFERPVLILVRRPILSDHPFCSLLRVPTARPAAEHTVDLVVAQVKSHLCVHCSVIIRPALNDWIKLPNQRLLRGGLMVAHDLTECPNMLFDRWFDFE